jgi:hypothetical protein
MQPNEISVSVVEEEGQSAVSRTFTRYDEERNKVTYITAGHELAARDIFQLYRTLPKPNGNFPGMGKSALKVTKDIIIPGTDGSDLKSPTIMEVSFSFPVGMTEEQRFERIETLKALVAAEFVDSLSGRLEV